MSDFLERNMQDPMISGFEKKNPQDMIDQDILFNEPLMREGECDGSDHPSPAHTVPVPEGQVYQQLNNAESFDGHDVQGTFDQQGIYGRWEGPFNQQHMWLSLTDYSYQTMTEANFQADEFQSYEEADPPNLTNVAAAVDINYYESQQMAQEPVPQQIQVAPQVHQVVPLDMFNLKAPSRYNKRIDEKADGKLYEKRSTRQSSKACSMQQHGHDEEEDQRVVPVAQPVSQTRRTRGKPAAAGDLTSVQKHRKKEKDFITSAPGAIEELRRRNDIIEQYNRQLQAFIPDLVRMIPYQCGPVSNQPGPFNNQPGPSQWNGY
jgi:hypothetical protein